MASGVLMLIFSFLAFYKVDGNDFFEGEKWSAWSNALSLFPLATIVVLATVALAVVVAVNRFASAGLPERVGLYSWSDLRLLVGVLGTITLLSYVFRSGDIDKGIGLYICTLAGIGLIAGAVMERSEAGLNAAADTDAGGPPAPGDWVIVGSGIVILIASFLNVVEETSAWGEGAFPIYAVPAILGVVMVIHIVVTKLAGADLPGSILGLSWNQIHIALGGWAALTMICLLVGRITVEGDDVSRKIGFWIMLLAAIGLAVGAVMRLQEVNRPGTPVAPPPGGNPPPPPPPA